MGALGGTPVGPQASWGAACLLGGLRALLGAPGPPGGPYAALALGLPTGQGPFPSCAAGGPRDLLSSARATRPLCPDAQLGQQRSLEQLGP